VSGGDAQASLLQRALRKMVAAEGRAIVAVPPFTAYLDRGTDLRYLNYAVPDAGASAPWDPEAIEALAAAFTEHGRLPRLEIVEACWPGLVDALVAAGFTVEGRLAGMTCEPHELRTAPAPEGVTVAAMGSDAGDDRIRARLEAQRSAFAAVAAPAPVTAADIDQARAASGGSVAAWGSDGTCLGAASWAGARCGVSEIVGVGVREPHRGRGIAGALTAAATRCAFEAGADLAFLTPGDEGAQRVYARAGFRERIRCVHLARD
jgi:GNAT superfamily N-acetyltransferase